MKILDDLEKPSLGETQRHLFKLTCAHANDCEECSSLEIIISNE
jgi:hypothetical protein